MKQMDNMQVELVEHNPSIAFSGISRYTRELYKYISPHILVKLTTNVDPPLTKYFSFLHHLPMGIQNHRPGNIVHFTQIMGCSQMLWKSTHPTVATVHDLGVLVCQEDKPLFNQFDRQILELQFLGLKRMNYYVVNSSYTKQCLIDLLKIPGEKIHFVQLGVDINHFKSIPDARVHVSKKYNLNNLNENFNILYTGSELPRKNIKLLLEAIAILKARGYSLQLIKVGGAGGEQWRERFLSDIRRLDLSDNVTVIGSVPEEDLPLFYNAVELAVSPTLLEGGFAWLAMEAMACGTPVIATDAALIPSAAAEAVLVVNRHCLEQLSDAIASCIDDAELRRKMSAIGKRVIQPYTWEATAHAMLQVYEKAMA